MASDEVIEQGERTSGEASEVRAETVATPGGELVGGVAISVLLIAVAVGLIWLPIALYPDQLPEPANPNFVDNIFDSRAVIWAARLLLVSAAVVLALGGVYIIVSTIIRMRNGEWLKRAGPFEVSEAAVTEIEDQFEFWRNAALNGQQELAQLRKRLRKSDELIDRLRLALDDG